MIKYIRRAGLLRYFGVNVEKPAPGTRIKQEETTMKKVLSVFMLLIVIAGFFGACDAKGSLSGKETERLYGEIEAVFKSGEIWNYRVLPSGEVNDAGESIGDAAEADVEFIKSLSGTVFDGSNQLNKYGLWTESKKKCRTCIIACSVPAVYNGKNCVAEEFSVTKTDGEAYTVTVAYRLTEETDSGTHRVSVRFKAQ